MSLYLNGKISYNMNSTTVHINIEKLETTYKFRSGSLRVYLITLDYFYKSGSIPGESYTSVCWFQLDPLNPGYHYPNLSKDCNRLSLQCRNYFAMILLEYDSNSQWTLRHVRMFGKKEESMIESRLIRLAIDDFFDEGQEAYEKIMTQTKENLKKKICRN